MKFTSIINAKSISLSIILYIFISFFYPLLNISNLNVKADAPGDLLDAVYMDEENGQAAPGHNLVGWSEADLPGNYGGYGIDPEPESNTHYRQIIERSCSEDAKVAYVTFHIRKNLAYHIEIEHLDGLSDDSFDIFLGDPSESDNYIGTYNDSGDTETWKKNMYDIPGDAMTGDITISLLSKGEISQECNQYGQVAISWIKLWGQNVYPPATKWLEPTAPAFFTRLTDTADGRVNMYFEENPDTDIEYYEYQTKNCNLDGTDENHDIVNMGDGSCSDETCNWSQEFGDSRRNIHRFRAVDTSGNKGEWSNWNNLSDEEFENISPNDFTYDNYLNANGVFTSAYGYIKGNGGFAVREQVRPSASITSIDPVIPYGGTTNLQTITLNYAASDTDTGIKQTDAMIAVKMKSTLYSNYSSVGTETHPHHEQSVTGSIDVTFPENGTYCLYIQAEDIADDLELDQLSGNVSIPEGEYTPENCEFKVTYIETVEITINRQRTTDHTPPLSGKVSDPNANVKIAINGGLRNIERKYYNAVNNEDGTWSLPDNTLHELTDGVYDVIAIATDSVGIEYEDKTEDELIIYTLKEEPIPEDKDSEGSDSNENDDSNQDNLADQGLGSVQVALDDRNEDKTEEKEISEELTEVLGERTCETSLKISGYIYYDKNENGQKDEGELGAGYIDLEIIMNGETVATARTDENGYWETEVCPGNYTVRVTSELPDSSQLIDSDEIEIEVKEDQGTGDINFRLKENKGFFKDFNFLWCLIPLVLLLLAVLVSQLTSRKEK